MSNTYFHTLYSNVAETMEQLSVTRRELLNCGYISEKKNNLLLNSIHVLCQTMVTLGNDIIACKEAETVDSELPEPLEEILTSLDM